MAARPYPVAVTLLLEENAYQELLHAELARHGVAATAGRATPLWIWQNRRSFEALHLHWIEHMFVRKQSRLLTLLTAAPAATLVVAAVATARLLRKRTVWTVHNPTPHDSAAPRVQRALFRAAARLCDAAIVHSASARAEVARLYGCESKLLVAPHGNYIGAYPPPAEDRAATRRRYGIADSALVLLAFGQLRAHKRLPELIEEFRGTPGEDIRLVVAGKPVRDEEPRVRRAAAGDPRVLLDLRFISDEEVAALHGMADAALVGHAGTFTSGALLLALSFGVPVIAPRVGSVTDVVSDGALIELGDRGLAAAIEELRRRSPSVMGEAALRSAERAPWSAAAEVHLRAYDLTPR